MVISVDKTRKIGYNYWGVIKLSSFLIDLYHSATMMDNVYPKALANFIFREVIEDAHSKYKIPQEDIRRMCKDAVNRAALFLQIVEDEKLLNAFSVEAYDCKKWDEPEMTEDLKARLALYKSLSEKIGSK